MTNTRLEGTAGPAPDDGASGTVAVAADQAKEHAGELARETRSEVAGVAGAAKEEARTLATGARQQLAREADAATSRAADALATTAQDLSAMASGSGAPDTPAANVVREIGGRVDQIATRLRDDGYQGVADDVARWARSHPGAFLLGAAGAGFLVGRVFRTADTGAIVDAAKGADQGSDGDDRMAGADRGGDRYSGDPDTSLFAEERRAGTTTGEPGLVPEDQELLIPAGDAPTAAETFAPPLDADGAPGAGAGAPSIDLTRVQGASTPTNPGV